MHMSWVTFTPLEVTGTISGNCQWNRSGTGMLLGRIPKRPLAQLRYQLPLCLLSEFSLVLVSTLMQLQDGMWFPYSY